MLSVYGLAARNRQRDRRVDEYPIESPALFDQRAEVQARKRPVTCIVTAKVNPATNGSKKKKDKEKESNSANGHPDAKAFIQPK
jgi:hypothetical protein